MKESVWQLCLQSRPTELNVLTQKDLGAADFKEAISKDFYFSLVIDKYSRFPEVEIVMIPRFDRILVTNGIPEKIKAMCHTLIRFGREFHEDDPKCRTHSLYRKQGPDPEVRQ